jgi:transcription-repair coupling factor (superfamily II helicase)
MKLVAQNAKKGAQFTPQGVLRFPLKATDPGEVLHEIRALLELLAANEEPEVAAPHQRR